VHNKKQLALFVITLLAASMAVYGIHYLIFRDIQHILIYGLGELAFVPIEVLLVTLVIDRLLEASEKRSMMNKLNMVIGAFFSEVGTDFMRMAFNLDKNFETIRKNFIVTGDWNDKTYAATKNSLNGYQYRIHVTGSDLVQLKEFLVGKREFLLRLLENPNLLEHEDFSEVLWAVFHLTEELSSREDVANLSIGDYEHIAVDTKRAYVALIGEWLDYMKHLQKAYPYLFAMAIRTNPFDPKAKAELP
jgi:uncharacterized protein (DUF2267 family)